MKPAQRRQAKRNAPLISSPSSPVARAVGLNGKTAAGSLLRSSISPIRRLSPTTPQDNPQADGSCKLIVWRDGGCGLSNRGLRGRSLASMRTSAADLEQMSGWLDYCRKTPFD
jgi:hypothetical protein